MKKNNSLSELDVLILDIQATGVNPANGHPTEIGWSRTRASSEAGLPDLVESCFCQLPEGEEVPRRVSRITGINTEDLAAGLSPRQAWKKLLRSARKTGSTGKNVACPVVIHFSRYEEPFLHNLHRQFSPKIPFPFDIICTHRLAQRLLPGLPRKSLRAIAGYFGHSVPELRRSADHVAATAFIWSKLARLLEDKNIHSLEELKAWLEEPLPKTPTPDREYLVEAAQRLNLPRLPGVYRMLRSNGDLLYIGKATSLKHRVNSYFQKKKRRSFAKNTLEMLTQAAHLEVFVTGSALEAALLEADEIKKHSPPYNTALRQRDREIVFYSRDLRLVSRQADEVHSLGPLPGRYTMPAFAAVKALLRGELTGLDDNEVCSLALGIPSDYIPGFQCFWDGVEEFRVRHNDELNRFAGDSLTRGLLLLGKQLRRLKLEELALAVSGPVEENGDSPGTSEHDDTGDSEAGERVWTPGLVADVLEGIIRHGAHLIRRSRWYCMLSESALAWTTGKTAGGHRRLLVMEDGIVVRQEDIDDNAPVPVPPGYMKTLAARRKSFDLVTYDRMRVLTTELRRLAADGSNRNMRMCLSPTAVLGHAQFCELLKWV